MPSKKTGGIESIGEDWPGKLSRMNPLNSELLRKLGKTRVGDPAPAAKKRSPKMTDSQISKSAQDLGYTKTKDGYFKKNGGPPPDPTKTKGK